MRKLFIHAGLHKTGTTSIQNFFNEHRLHFKGYGFLYPLAGIVDAYPGHHNLAWQLTQDRRFDSRRGTLNSLFSEIQSFNGDVLISSEDFEGVLGCPNVWVALKKEAEKCGFTLRLIIFLREQSSYLHSMFLQNIILGRGECFRNDFEECVTFGEIRKNDWRFHFDFHKLINALKVCNLDQLIVRDYSKSGSTDVIDTLCETMNIPPEAYSGLNRVHKNGRRPLSEYLIRFHDNRFRMERAFRGAQNFRLIEKSVEKVSIAAPLISKLHDRFMPGNSSLAQEFNLSTLTSLVNNHASLEDKFPDIYRVFSFETSLLLRRWFSDERVPLNDYKRWSGWITHQS